MTNKNNTLELKILPKVVLRAPRPNDRRKDLNCVVRRPSSVVVVAVRRLYLLSSHVSTLLVLFTVRTLVFTVQ